MTAIRSYNDTLTVNCAVGVDFHTVPSHQAAIDARLENWARWSHNRGTRACGPMFRLYRSTDAKQQYGEAPGSPVDVIDAVRVQTGVSELPEQHRIALSWCYIKRNNPRRAASDLGQTLDGLAELITAGRQILIRLGY